MNCPKCGNPIANDAKFCIKCGAKVEAASEKTDLPFCAHCGYHLEHPAKFCIKCGATIPIENASEAAAPKQTATQQPNPPKQAQPKAQSYQPPQTAAYYQPKVTNNALNMISGILGAISSIMHIIFFIIFAISGIITIVRIAQVLPYSYYYSDLTGILVIILIVTIAIILLLLAGATFNSIYTIQTFRHRSISAGKTIALLVLNAGIFALAIFDIICQAISYGSGGAITLCVFIMIAGIIGAGSTILGLVSKRR